jgi:hypothetical protein
MKQGATILQVVVSAAIYLQSHVVFSPKNILIATWCRYRDVSGVATDRAAGGA